MSAICNLIRHYFEKIDFPSKITSSPSPIIIETIFRRHQAADVLTPAIQRFRIAFKLMRSGGSLRQSSLRLRLKAINKSNSDFLNYLRNNI